MLLSHPRLDPKISPIFQRTVQRHHLKEVIRSKYRDLDENFDAVIGSLYDVMQEHQRMVDMDNHTFAKVVTCYTKIIQLSMVTEQNRENLNVPSFLRLFWGWISCALYDTTLFTRAACTECILQAESSSLYPHFPHTAYQEYFFKEKYRSEKVFLTPDEIERAEDDELDDNTEGVAGVNDPDGAVYHARFLRRGLRRMEDHKRPDPSLNHDAMEVLREAFEPISLITSLYELIGVQRPVVQVSAYQIALDAINQNWDFLVLQRERLQQMHSDFVKVLMEHTMVTSGEAPHKFGLVDYHLDMMHRDVRSQRKLFYAVCSTVLCTLLQEIWRITSELIVSYDEMYPVKAMQANPSDFVVGGCLFNSVVLLKYTTNLLTRDLVCQPTEQEYTGVSMLFQRPGKETNTQANLWNYFSYHCLAVSSEAILRKYLEVQDPLKNAKTTVRTPGMLVKRIKRLCKRPLFSQGKNYTLNGVGLGYQTKDMNYWNAIRKKSALRLLEGVDNEQLRRVLVYVIRDANPEVSEAPLVFDV